jgi:hypothetical protein
MVMIFLGLICVCKEVNMLLYFRNNLMLKIKVHIKVSKRCFIWFKLDRGSWVHLPTLSWNCGGIKRNADDQNIDMIFIMLLDNICMGITSKFKDDATHLTYTPL